MQKSVKKSNKKTGAAGKYTAPGAFGGAQPSNLVELIEAQRGKAASSAGKKPAADTALANKWADLQLQSFGQFGADPLSPTWGRVEETPEMTAAEREREAQWYEQNANAYNALGADGQSTVQRANDAANRWDIANNMYPWMLDTSGLGMPIDQQLAMADAYEERRQATAALEQASGWVKAVLVVACAAGVSALFYGRRKKREAARQCAVPEREETQKEKMASVSSGMQLPPGFKMPF